MLATLNLQLLSLDTSAEPLTLSAVATDVGGDIDAVFADLLRLRVDASLNGEPSGGVILPENGNELPRPAEVPMQELVAIPVSLPGLTPDPVSANPEPLTDGVELVTPEPLFLAVTPQATESLHAAILPPATQVLPGRAAPAPLGPTTPVLDEFTQRVGLETKPLPAALPQQQGPVTAGARQDIAPPPREGLDALLPPALATRDRVDFPLPVVSTPVKVDAAETLPIVELPKRAETSPLVRPETLGEEFTEVLKPRLAVTQPVQTLQAQLNAHTPQALFTSTPASVASGELTYAAAAQQASDAIATPVRDLAWGERIGERVVLMAGNQLKTAEIRLSPAELGPLRVQVSVDDGATNVTFHAQHAVTREALEQAMPRLRELLADSGLSLGQASIGEHDAAEGNRERNADGAEATQAADDSQDGDSDDERPQVLPGVTPNSLVDTFA